jgi:hypothetical protein
MLKFFEFKSNDEYPSVYDIEDYLQSLWDENKNIKDYSISREIYDNGSVYDGDQSLSMSGEFKDRNKLEMIEGRNIIYDIILTISSDSDYGWYGFMNIDNFKFILDIRKYLSRIDGGRW